MLNRTTIKEQVYRIIKERILTQKYTFGERINIASLSEDLCVSNTPIREALAMLEADGLVSTSPNTGTRVITLSNKTFKDLTQTVQILLIGGYELCVKEERIDELIPLMEKRLQLQRKFLKKKEYYNFAKASIDFDECLLIIPRNDMLFSLYKRLFDLLFLVVLHDHQTRDVDRTSNIREHELILDAIKQRNHESVKSLIVKHYNKPLIFNS
jgi:DNA-binding GntR family transcriptional regulator